MLLHEYLSRQSVLHPEKTALWSDGVSYTYSELAQQALQCVALFMACGVQKGDRIVLWMPNGVDQVVGLFAAWASGACAVPIGATTPLERCAQQIRHCGARVVVAPDARLAPLREALRSTLPQPMLLPNQAVRSPQGVRIPESHENERSHKCALAPPPAVIDLDIAAIIYTSGSSGIPKGVIHSHRSIDTATRSINGYLENGPDDVILSVLQLNFSYGLLQLLGTFRTGGTLVLEKGIGYPYEVIRQFSRHHITGFAGSPTIWAMILQLSNVGPEDVSTVRYITNAAAAIPAPFVPRLAALFTAAKIYLMHGMTECIRTGFLPPDEALLNPTSIGRAMENVELWIVDDEGRRLGPGETGELVIRGSTLMLGYWNDPTSTESVLRPGPFPWDRCLYSGDMFRMDQKGYFYFVARKDDIIKSRGEKVSPVEVEAVIYQLPDVQECRIIGVPDDLLGNRVRAEIVLRQGQTLSERKVKGHCSEHLEPHKVPHEVAFVDSLPKTDGGKIIRNQKQGEHEVKM